MKDYYNAILRKSIIILFLSFGLLFAVGTVIVWKYDLSLWFAVGFSVSIALIQFLIGPAIIGMVYGVLFEDYDKYISEDVLKFIEESCKEYNIPHPKIGIIKDGNPNAFTYGHIPRDAKLVITTGLLDVLNEEEQKAVIAHELGHIKHYDFITMMVVSLIPMLLYQIYLRTKDKKADAKYIVGLGAYAAYLLSGFLVLGFSRMREYYSDNFAKEVMGNGEHLRNALVKIAYGTASREKDKNPKASCMAFTNNLQNDSWMLSTYKLDDNNKMKLNLMKWDLKNPWAKWYEINSTHPLTGKRIMALDHVEIEEDEGSTKGLGSFLLDAVINMLPYALAIGVFIRTSLIKEIGFIDFIKGNPLYIVILGGSMLLRYYYSYGKGYEERTIEELLSRDDASPIKGIPTVLKGKVIGKGIPGLFYSEDLVVDDGTGIMLVDYRQPLKILEGIFGLFEADKFQEKEVEVVGWYKRGMRPYFVCRYIKIYDDKYRCYNYLLTKILAYGLVILGLCIKLFI
ncbi:zinc metalloprotease HtpX [Clostridium cochlearium]|uniref:zinc metalloprotease HtpX n=1 Tax=Clostridium cochlearium TaxID=1494 RepID=UPI000B94A051|nr:zinc metalloprotease HtpX [Clostridium cochlearium]SNV74488.1 protease htpX-like protein [Clostridium cochlearium]STA92310.1 protease htpX-like protein [Clostridium cochlearium]